MDTSTKDKLLQNTQLGKETEYVFEYNPEFLFVIPRAHNQEFYGFDIWNAYELSWLNEKGKPQAAIAEFIFPCTAPDIVESKSLKLYLNPFTNNKFPNSETVTNTIKKDLSTAAGADVDVKVTMLSEINNTTLESFPGDCIDHLDININEYEVNASRLSIENDIVEETLYSHLLKSNCPATSQPDWASVIISYQGKKLNRESLLKYIISYRNHSEFHEHCVERIFTDIMRHCQPDTLTVEARYTRRGGLDINPIRSTDSNIQPNNVRRLRQ